MATQQSEQTTELKEDKIAIIGSGLIGRSWAMLFASGGYLVSLFDTDSRQVKDAMTDIQIQLTMLSERGLGRGTLSADVQFSRITTSTSLLEAVNDAVYIQECVPEKRELKRAVLLDVDAAMTSTAILASSTSAMMPSLLSDHLTNKDRFLVAHPTNPPFYVPVVELVPASWTADHVTTATSEIMAAIGQVPIVFYKEVDGFAVGRIQFAILSVAYDLIKNDVCDVEAIEVAMTEGLGMWYAFFGPFQVEHLNADGFMDLCNKYGEAVYRVQKTFAAPEKMGGPTVEKMFQQLELFCPLDKLQEKRQWRDGRLAALSRLIRDLDREEATPSGGT
ncbi:lambda-crystallin-like isoform X1 [Haliotis rufescens]|uniref:lambda-crystallin-like isoform X1 n=1 Tax=Haliotis rufescens TaxID=6454 RepID=UPI00201F3A42|nr:lambda-crystallin-like isoform X1 [Haliotis rufescens]